MYGFLDGEAGVAELAAERRPLAGGVPAESGGERGRIASGLGMPRTCVQAHAARHRCIEERSSRARRLA